MTKFSERLNSVRASVLGANDGVVSVSALLVGVAAAQPAPAALLVAALAAILAGALSMAVGEYVSVHAQVDAELEADAAVTVSPLRAALSSALSFVAGAALPTAAILCSPAALRIPVTMLSVLAALALSGWAGARLTDVAPLRPMLRVVCGGALALAVTYCAGWLAA
jgi:vacuolar iron transporter family protein